jgi:hypothetical protein
MTLEQLQEELDDVNAAIRAIRNGAQSYSTQSRSVTKVSYEGLLKERDKLEAQIATMTYGGHNDVEITRPIEHQEPDKAPCKMVPVLVHTMRHKDNSQSFFRGW